MSALVTLLHVAVILIFFYSIISLYVCSVARRERSMYRVLVWTPDGRRLIDTPRHRLEDSIKMDLKIIGLCGYILDSSGSGHRLVVHSCEHGNKP
jgi:hypothetical protein